MSLADKYTTLTTDKIPKVYEAGQKSEYDKFWDGFQTNGERTNYTYAFAYGWSKDAFKPKYNITPTSTYSMFMMSKIECDLPAYLEEIGVNIDFTTATATDATANLFRGAKFTRVGVISTTMVSALGTMFWGATKLVTIDKLILKEDGSQTHNANNFNSCGALANLTIEGVIGKNNFDIHWSTKLSGESIVSVIEALSSTTSGLSVTLSQTAVDNMVFPITSAQTDVTYNSWSELENTKTNWTISLA